MSPPSLPAPAGCAALRHAVLDWYDRRGRTLAFRSSAPDPWAVLLAEVISQQTQVARVETGWRALRDAFPTPAAMAAAVPADVIRAWRGLGHNRRALDLHRAAVAIVAAGGHVPGDVDALLALPGVGPYTARAVAAIAFARPVGAVDVNVRRVLVRLVGGGSPMTPAAAQAAADALVDRERPGAWTHALMDLGATVCRPARPSCPDCPARPWCAAATAADEGHVPAWAAGVTGAALAGPASRAALRRRRVPTRFAESRRWLRGRIVDRLRDAPSGAGVAFGGAIGSHPPDAVAAALRALAREGLVELGADGRARLAGSSAGSPAPPLDVTT